MKPITRREVFKRGGWFLLSAATCSLLPGFVTGCSQQELDQGKIYEIMQQIKTANINDIRLTVVYDNVPYRKGLLTDWGFACLVEGLEKTILFDSGRYYNPLMSNLLKLQIDPQEIEQLFISHDHPDHVGGTLKMVETNNNLNVTLIGSFPSGFKKLVKKRGAGVTEIGQPQIFSKTSLSSGEMRSAVKNEHALIILTDKGSIIITGCAHPGVVEIVERAKKITNKEIILLVGGFHLLMDSGSSIQKKAARLQELGVRHVAPSHCSGGEAREVFAKVYGDKFIKSGLGRTITASDLV